METRNRRVRRRSGLSDRDRVLLDIERTWGPTVYARSPKLAEARARLGVGPDEYTLLLQSLINDDEALAIAPEVIEPLRQLQRSRRLFLG